MNNKLILPVKPLNDVFYRNCGYHCLITALHYFKRKYQLLIANAASVIEPSGNKYVEQRSPDDLLKDMAINAKGFFESKDICADLLQYLSRGEPAVIHVDCFYLQEKKEFFQKDHWGHSILVCGYDLENEVFYIVDNETIFSTRYQNTQLSFHELKAAYAGYLQHFNPQRNHICFTAIAEEGPAINYTDEEIRNIAIAHLKSIEQDEVIFANVSSAIVSDIIIAKRVELYKFENIIKHQTLVCIVGNMIAGYEHIRNVLTKMELRKVYSASMIQEKLQHITPLEKQYKAAVSEL